MDVLVVGAGLAGASAARALADAGRRVLILDKGRGPGGRLSTRRTDSGTFDHGAAVLQAEGEAFRRWLERRSAEGCCAPYGEGGWVGVPGMNALVHALLASLAPRWGSTVAALDHRDGAWHAFDAGGDVVGVAPWLVLAVPAPQARALLAGPAGRDPKLAALETALAGVRYAPCWAGMIRTAGVEATEAARPRSDLAGGVLARVVAEGDKPGRTPGHWVVHAQAAWSESHLELAAEDVANVLRSAFVEATGIADDAIVSVTAHRWRYAQPLQGTPCTGIPELGLALAGDAIGWRGGSTPSAERAWVSGLAAVETILAGSDQPKS